MTMQTLKRNVPGYGQVELILASDGTKCAQCGRPALVLELDSGGGFCSLDCLQMFYLGYAQAEANAWQDSEENSEEELDHVVPHD